MAQSQEGADLRPGAQLHHLHQMVRCRKNCTRFWASDPDFVLSNDPRGWAFSDDSGRFVGQSGVIVTPAAEVASTLAVAIPYLLGSDSPSFTR